jgi:hypothetical protein
MKNARNKIFTNLHVIRASDSDGEGRPSFGRHVFGEKESVFKRLSIFRGNQKRFLGTFRDSIFGF